MIVGPAVSDDFPERLERFLTDLDGQAAMSDATVTVLEEQERAINEQLQQVEGDLAALRRVKDAGACLDTLYAEHPYCTLLGQLFAQSAVSPESVGLHAGDAERVDRMCQEGDA